MATLVTLPALVSLYQTDRDLHTLELALEKAQRQAAVQKQKIQQLSTATHAQEDQTRHVQAQMSAQELDMKMRQEHIEKMRTSLNNTKTNKEYSAILVQISAEKAEVSKIEGVVLEQMGQVETGQKLIASLREQVRAEEARLITIERESSDRVSDLQKQIAALRTRRATAAASVPSDALKQYDRVRQKYPGDALAPVEYDENDMDSVSCGGCYMGLQLDDINLLRSRDELRRCGSCGRFLYLPEMASSDPERDAPGRREE